MEKDKKDYRLFEIGLCDGIHFEYPMKWKLAKATPKAYVFLPEGKVMSQRYPKSAILIMTEDAKEKLNGNDTLENYVEMMTHSLKNDALNFIEEHTATLGDEVTGHYFKYDYSESEFIEEYAMLKDGVLYTLQLTTPSSKDRDELSVHLKHMASTFKIVDRSGLKYAYLTPLNLLWEMRYEDGRTMETYTQVTTYLPPTGSRLWKRQTDADGRRTILVSKLVDDLVLSYKVGRIAVNQGFNANMFIDVMEKELSKDSIQIVKNDLPKDALESVAMGLPNHKYTAVQFQTKFKTTKEVEDPETKEKKQVDKIYDSEMILVVVEDTFFQFGISTKGGDMYKYHPLFNAIYGSLRLKEVPRDTSFKVDGIATKYSLYANLMAKFCILVPDQFKSTDHSGHNNLIFTSTQEETHISEISLEKLPFEDPASDATISLVEYIHDTKHLFSSQLQSMNIVNEKPSRMGKYKAASMLFDSTVAIKGNNPNITETGTERYLVKLAVMERNLGIKICTKALQDKFESSYDSCIFMFDGFRLLK